jgi:hypothetical protein
VRWCRITGLGGGRCEGTWSLCHGVASWWWLSRGSTRLPTSTTRAEQCTRRSSNIPEAFRILDNGASWRSRVAQHVAHSLPAGRGEGGPLPACALSVHRPCTSDAANRRRQQRPSPSAVRPLYGHAFATHPRITSCNVIAPCPSTRQLSLSAVKAELSSRAASRSSLVHVPCHKLLRASYIFVSTTCPKLHRCCCLCLATPGLFSSTYSTVLPSFYESLLERASAHHICHPPA